MGYNNITNLKFYSPKQSQDYFLDANIWLLVLNQPIRLKWWQKLYIDFFEELTTTPKVKIVVSSLLLSEIINRHMRDVGMRKFAKANHEADKINSSYYKEKYRPSDQYKIDYELICDDLKNHHKNVKLISDGLGESIHAKHILKSPPKSLDFNDHYYYLLAKKHNLPIITHDKDFLVQDVDIITLNKSLLDRRGT